MRPMRRNRVSSCGRSRGGSAVDQVGSGEAVLMKWRRMWRQVARTLLGAIAFIAWIAVVFGAPAHAPGLVGSNEIRWISACIAIGASLILLHIGRLAIVDPPRTSVIGPEVPDSPTIADITNAMQQAS